MSGDAYGGPFQCNGCDKHIGSRQIRHIDHHDGTRYIFCPDCAADARAGEIGPKAPSAGDAGESDPGEQTSMPSSELL